MLLSKLTAAAALALGAAALSTPASAQGVGVYIGPGGYYGDGYGPRVVYESPGYYYTPRSYYRGYTGPLRFQSTTDGTLPTSFLIDDVSVYTAPEVGFAPESGMWWNPAEPGRGFFIDYRNDQALVGAYMFEPNQWATWYSGQLTRVGPIFNGFAGELQRHQGGQSLAGAWRLVTSTRRPRYTCSRLGLAASATRR